MSENSEFFLCCFFSWFFHLLYYPIIFNFWWIYYFVCHISTHLQLSISFFLHPHHWSFVQFQEWSSNNQHYASILFHAKHDKIHREYELLDFHENIFNYPSWVNDRMINELWWNRCGLHFADIQFLEQWIRQHIDTHPQIAESILKLYVANLAGIEKLPGPFSFGSNFFFNNELLSSIIITILYTLHIRVFVSMPFKYFACLGISSSTSPNDLFICRLQKMFRNFEYFFSLCVSLIYLGAEGIHIYPHIPSLTDPPTLSLSHVQLLHPQPRFSLVAQLLSP